MERFDAEAALAAIERFRVTATQMVPTMFVRMLQLPEETRDRVRHVVAAAGRARRRAVPARCQGRDDLLVGADSGRVLRRHRGPRHHRSSPPPSGDTKRGSVGKAAMGVLHICDDDGTELAAGEIGTIYFERDVAPFDLPQRPRKDCRLKASRARQLVHRR